MKFLGHLLGITKLDKGKNQCIREKTGVQNIVKEMKQYQKKWLQHVQRMERNKIIIIILAAIGLSPGGSGYFTCTQI